MSLFGVGLDIEVKRINTQFKILIQKKGGIGIRSLAAIFRRFDKNGNKSLDQEEFTQALAEFGLFPKIVETQALMKYYDVNQDGNISYEEFIRGLREPLSERRQKIVLKAFQQLDKDGSGRVTVSDVAEVYNVSFNKEFQEGSKSRDQIIEEFLQNFEGAKGNRDGIITIEEFLDYYSDISFSITRDDQFIQMIESVWCIAEDEEAGVFQEQIKDLIQILRMKLRVITNQSGEEYVLRNIFKDFDTNRSGNLTIDELVSMLSKLQISCERKFVTALFKHFDANKNGVIEFEEFCHFLINDPYK